jgi:hypothetical protein
MRVTQRRKAPKAKVCSDTQAALAVADAALAAAGHAIERAGDAMMRNVDGDLRRLQEAARMLIVTRSTLNA